jgi:hypothetical protein
MVKIQAPMSFHPFANTRPSFDNSLLKDYIHGASAV